MYSHMMSISSSIVMNTYIQEYHKETRHLVEAAIVSTFLFFFLFLSFSLFFWGGGGGGGVDRSAVL